MELSRYLTPNAILIDPPTADKETLLRRMIAAAMEGPAFREAPDLDVDAVYEAVMAREAQRPTALGEGLACPHARLEGLHGIGLCVALLRDPVEFGRRSGEQVRAVFLLLVPMERPTLGVKLLAQIARLWTAPDSVAELMALRTPSEVCAYLIDRVFNIDVPLTASDIMRPARENIGPETPLKTVTRLMLAKDMEAIGVVSSDMTLLGEITCDRLFTLGMPEFFNQLKSVSFISEFDPFDRYFEKEANQVAGDVMSTDFSAVEETATLLEVVFELAVRRRPKVHVLRNGKRVGVIDRVVVLDRILNA